MAEEWKTMSELDKSYFKNAAEGEHDRAEMRRLAPEVMATDENPTAAYNPGILWGLGAKTMPISEENFTKCARAVFVEKLQASGEVASADDAADAPLCGSRRYCAALREKLQASVFVKDEGGSPNIDLVMPTAAPLRPHVFLHPTSPYRPSHPPSQSVSLPR